MTRTKKTSTGGGLVEAEAGAAAAWRVTPSPTRIIQRTYRTVNKKAVIDLEFV